MESELTAHIFDIQSFSIHDGPGHRTTLFFSGCPLNCWWCCNPEGKEKKDQLLYLENNCSHCYRCIENCSKEAISVDDQSHLKRKVELCAKCDSFYCLQNCFFGALRKSGKRVSLSEIKKRIERDRRFWGNSSEGGGVTFSGGEPLMQASFLRPLIEWCQKEGIHTAIETSCYAPTEIFLATLLSVDWCFLDIKHMDNQKHQLATSVSNELIIDNISQLAKRKNKESIIIRVPFIPGFNDDLENAERLKSFLLKNSLKYLNLLPFHSMGRSKYEQLGLRDPYLIHPIADSSLNLKEKWEEIMGQASIRLYWGSETPY